MKGSLWPAWRQQRNPAACGAAVLLAVAALAAYFRSDMLDDLRSGLFDHCGPGPLYCSGPDDGVPRFLDVEPLRLLGALDIALLALARRHGLHARFTEDWETRPHGQSKIRVSRSPLPA